MSTTILRMLANIDWNKISGVKVGPYDSVYSRTTLFKIAKLLKLPNIKRVGTSKTRLAKLILDYYNKSVTRQQLTEREIQRCSILFWNKWKTGDWNDILQILYFMPKLTNVPCDPQHLDYSI